MKAPFGLAIVAALLPSCVPKDAGTTDVQALIRKQMGLELTTRRTSKAPSAASERLLTRPLTTITASRVALLENGRIAAALEKVGVSRARLVGATRLPNPVAEAGLLLHEGAPSIDLGVMEDLTDLLLLSSRRDAADAELRASAHEVAAEIVDVLFRVRAQVVIHQADHQLLKLERRVEEAALAALEGAQRLHEAGNITELALARHHAAYETARLTASELELRLSEDRLVLAALLGIDAGGAWRVAEWKPTLPTEERPLDGLLERALSANLRLAALGRRLDAADDRQTYETLRGWLPELRAGAIAEREEGEWSFGPAVELELPLFYQGQGEVAAVAAEAKSARALASSLVLELRNTTLTTITRLQAARARAERLEREVLPVHRRLVAQALLQYNAMNLGVFELLAAKREQLDADRRWLEALRDYRLARNAIDQLRAGGNPSDLGGPSGASVGTRPSAPDAH